MKKMSTCLTGVLLMVAALCCFSSGAVAQSPSGGALPTPVAPPPVVAPPAVPVPASPVQPDSVVAAKSKVIMEAQERLTRLGFYTAGIDGVAGRFTLRAFCAFQLLTNAHGVDAPAGRRLLPREDRRLLYHITQKSQLQHMHYKNAKKFIRVSLRCQTLFLVSHRQVVQVWPISTGHPGHDSKGRASFATPAGHFVIGSKFPRDGGDNHDGWDKSAQYENAPMFRPMQFQGGKYFHGEPSPAYVAPFKASHGCVRLIKEHMAALWWQVGIGTPVLIS